MTVGARVYTANGNDDQIHCFNYAAGAECDNFPHPDR